MKIDYLSPEERSKVLGEILENEENLIRKEESLMAMEIFKGRQSQFIIDRISRDYTQKTASESRKLTSINLTNKLIKEQASLYKCEPKREWTDLNDQQTDHVKKLYKHAMANVKFKKANQIYKLADQSAIQVVLKEGYVQLRSLYHHHYDVIPSVENPEKAECYIVSSFDKSRLFSRLRAAYDKSKINGQSYFADRWNQKTGDPDDYQGKEELFYWWTKDLNFITNSKGQYVDPYGNVLKTVSPTDYVSPVAGVLPFVDVASDKDFEFFVRSGYSDSNFNIDLGVLLSDTAEVNRLQGFSQAVIASVEEPKDIKVGPRKLLWLRLDPKDTEATRPAFQFATPSPDMQASLQLISNFMSLYLTSRGLSPKVVNTMGEKESFASGIDRWLAMIEKFESSQDDADLFQSVEAKVWDIMKVWNNTFAQATENGFIKELSGVLIPEQSQLTVKYEKPQMLMSESDKLDVIQKKRELGLMTQKEAIMLDRGVDEKKAEEVLEDIAEEDLGETEETNPPPPPEGEVEVEETETEEANQ